MNWNMHLIRCFEIGARAFFDGKPPDCPYHGNGFNRQRREYWNLGYARAKSGKSVIDERREIRDCM